MHKTIVLIYFFLLVYSNLTGQSKKDSLYVFVGEKIEVTYIKRPISEEKQDTVIKNHDTSIRTILVAHFDSKYIATYKVVQNVYGNYKADTITFTVYDHYGTPAFSKYKHVLLFVYNYNGNLIHEKYQYFDVYKTKDNRWASSYKPIEYSAFNKADTTIKPEVIHFKKKVKYKIKEPGEKYLHYFFPTPYYKIKKTKAIPILGNYIEQLFELKKTGVLKQRGYLF